MEVRGRFVTSRMPPPGFRGRFCLRARFSGPDRVWHKSCACTRVVLQGCAGGRVSLWFRLGPRAPRVSLGSRNPVRKRVDACGLGGRCVDGALSLARR